jgi:uroporphyrinogen-III synthase
MRPLVIVRPEPAASSTASMAEGLGLTVIQIPLFRIEPIEWNAPDPAHYDALLVTSANAIRHGGGGLDRLRPLPVHCVGKATANAASEAGFTIDSVGDSGVDSLLRGLPSALRLLHLSGLDRRDPEAPAQSIDRIPVYRSAAIDPPENLKRVERSVVAIHSPRAAARLGALVDDAGLERSTLAIAAISPEATAAAGDGWQSVEAAAEPTSGALLALASRLCNNPC